VLYQPEIPANTGNIGRLCLGANAELHLIKPMKFLINDKYLKRAGLDYWDKVNCHTHEDWDSFIGKYNECNIYFFSTKGTLYYHQMEYKQGDIFVFGPETRGLPIEMLNQYDDKVIKIPMYKDIRSLNLSNSVSIVLYEGLRQTGFVF
jgi:tRNA (cytidine/uridine-2'-O-)-methyltransferase